MFPHLTKGEILSGQLANSQNLSMDDYGGTKDFVHQQDPVQPFCSCLTKRGDSQRAALARSWLDPARSTDHTDARVLW